jgi:hypothetical protein
MDRFEIRGRSEPLPAFLVFDRERLASLPASLGRGSEALMRSGKG